MKAKSFSRVQLFATPWTAAYQAPPSMGFSRQEYWNGVPSPSLAHTIITCILIGVGPQSHRSKLAIEEKTPWSTLGLQRRLILYTFPYPEPSMDSITLLPGLHCCTHSSTQTFFKCIDVPAPCQVLGKPWFVKVDMIPALVELQRSDRDRQKADNHKNVWDKIIT